MTFASTSRLGYKPYMQSVIPPECLDCADTPPCDEPHCATSALSAQCTDQCVVIACTDPNHPQLICDKDGPHNRCDLVCDEAADCADCHGWDAFLQCCQEYQSYNTVPQQLHRGPQHQPEASQHFDWDTSFNDFWCDCSDPQGAKPPSYDRAFDMDSDPYSSEPHPQAEQEFLKKISHPPAPENTFPMDSFPRLQPEKPAASFACMWDSCHESFSTLEELVGHVNLRHLVTSSSSSNEPIKDDAFNLTRPPTPVPCLWGDCSDVRQPHDRDMLQYHLMREHLCVIPPADRCHHGRPSEGSQCLQYKETRGRLANVLMHDDGESSPPVRYCDQTLPELKQFGLDPNIPSSSTTSVQQVTKPDTDVDRVQDQNSAHMNLSSSRSSSSTPAQEQQHSCTSGTHDCRWTDCGLSFGSCDELTTHITSVHVGGGKAHYECFWEKCTRNGTQGFQSKQKICRHVQSHTGHRPFQCTICNQNFSEAATLQQHIRRHTQEKPYVCDHRGCGKSFAITGALTIHKRTHNGDKPFKCTFCDRGFAESSNLSKHLRTHTGARPYTCHEPGCNKTFARPDQLTRHKGVHNKQKRGIGGTTED